MSKGHPRGNCRTCHCELVESINDGGFGTDECACCERHRYQTQLELLDTVIEIRKLTESLDYEDSDPLGELEAKTETLDDIRNFCYSAIKRARS